MDRTKKRSSNPNDTSPNQTPNKRSHLSSSPPPKKPPTFSSYLQSPNLTPKIKLLCEILATTPSPEIEKSLQDTGVRITTEDVEQILKHSYGFPGPAVKFFRWAGRNQLNDKHSPYGWNLVVDLLGKNMLFEAMWDAIRSMKHEGLLSLATFASVFSSYVLADRVDEAIMTFEAMEQYGCGRDIVALNSLLSAICREGKTVKGRDFLDIAKGTIRPDRDTYAILLEGWENERDVENAHRTFGEMLNLFGWDPRNVPAYDAFLNTILKGRDGLEESMKFFNVMRSNGCFPGMKFFKASLDEHIKRNQTREVCILWEMMRMSGCIADTEMYNSMITLQCYMNQPELACKFLDEMVLYGAFPDSETYNIMLKFLLKMRKMRDVSWVFNEMLKNECVPTEENCMTGITFYVDGGDPDMAIKVWKCMIGNKMKDGLERSGTTFVVGLCDLNRLSEARKYAEDAIERGIKLGSKALSTMRQNLNSLGKGYVYEELLKKWKSKAH